MLKGIKVLFPLKYPQHPTAPWIWKEYARDRCASRTDRTRALAVSSPYISLHNAKCFLNYIMRRDITYFYTRTPACAFYISTVGDRRAAANCANELLSNRRDPDSFLLNHADLTREDAPCRKFQGLVIEIFHDFPRYRVSSNRNHICPCLSQNWLSHCDANWEFVLSKVIYVVCFYEKSHREFVLCHLLLT